MKGKYHIIVQNNKLRYELDIRRNITIIRGDSATGKTQLIRLLEQAATLGESSGVEVFCERIESRDYFSWERFFAALLAEYTEGSYFRYTKSKLNETYLHGKMKQAILNVMEGVGWCE